MGQQFGTAPETPAPTSSPQGGGGSPQGGQLRGMLDQRLGEISQKVDANKALIEGLATSAQQSSPQPTQEGGVFGGGAGQGGVFGSPEAPQEFTDTGIINSIRRSVNNRFTNFNSSNFRPSK